MAEEKITQPQTMYSSLSDSGLYAMYRHDSWVTLDESQRHDLLQETVNREAIADGNKLTANVSFGHLPVDEDGVQQDGNIILDYNKTVLDKQEAVINGKTITTDAKCPSYDALTTVLHEYQHVKQDAIIDGKITADPAVKEALEANMGTLSVVDGQIGCQYLSGETDYGLYYLQPCELDAFTTSETKTDAIIDSIKAQYGSDPAMVAYADKMAKYGYAAQLAEFRAQYNNPNVEVEVSKALQNAYNNTNIAVDPNVEAAVKTEMVASANALFANNNAGYTPKTEIPTETEQLADGYISAMSSVENDNGTVSTISADNDGGVDSAADGGTSAEGGLGI